MNNSIKDKIIQLAEKHDVVIEDEHHFSKFADEVIAALGSNKHEVDTHQTYGKVLFTLGEMTDEDFIKAQEGCDSSISYAVNATTEIHQFHQFNQIQPFTEDQIKSMLTQAWRAGFLSTGEGQNAEVSVINRDGKSSYDELCEEEVVAIMQGKLDYQPSITEHVKQQLILN